MTSTFQQHGIKIGSLDQQAPARPALDGHALGLQEAIEMAQAMFPDEPEVLARLTGGEVWADDLADLFGYARSVQTRLRLARLLIRERVVEGH